MTASTVISTKLSARLSAVAAVKSQEDVTGTCPAFPIGFSFSDLNGLTGDRNSAEFIGDITAQS
jgi:hypothetical protein